MKKLFAIFFIISIFVAPVFAVTRGSDFVSGYNYEVMQPFMNNRMRASLNPGVPPGVQTPSTVMARVITDNGNTPLSSYVKESAGAAKSARKVVPRGSTASAARSAAVPTGVSNLSMARSASGASGTTVNSNLRGVNVAPTSAVQNASTARRVVARSARTDVSGSRGGNATSSAQNAPNSNVTMESCLADYSRCMDDYCHRPNAAYDRCYCSSRLAQIDAEYQPAITELINQIAYIRNGGSPNVSDQEMEDYWDSIFGGYTESNALADLNDALNINWADTESRVRGQNAFVVGHDYCIQHLAGCYYGANNLRSIYRSQITRDCNTYEKNLNRIKTAAESIVENYGK